MVDPEQIIVNMSKPKVSDVLKLVRWLMQKASVVKVTPGDNPAQTGFAMIEAIISSINEEELLELGKILLGDAGKDLAVDDLDLGWISEAVAVWMEKVDLPRILKNANRVAAALK